MSRGKQDQYVVKKNTREINLKEYFELFKKRIWIIVVVTVIATLAGYFYTTFNNTPIYQTSTRMIIGSDSEDMSTLMVMIKDPIIMGKVKEELQLTKPSEEIADQIEVTRIENSQVIQLSVIAQDPKLAVDIADTTAAAFKSEIVNILDFTDVQLLSGAKENPIPINKTQNRIIIISFVFGLITGIGLVFLLDSLDGKVRKEREVEEILGVPVLGVVSNMNRNKIYVKKNKQNKQKELNLRGETVGIK